MPERLQTTVTINVATRTGIAQVEAKAFGVPPLFGVHPFMGIDGPDPDYTWSITHLPTGLRMPTPDNRRMTQRQAQAIARRIAKDEGWRDVTFDTARHPEVRPLVAAYRSIWFQEVDRVAGD